MYCECEELGIIMNGHQRWSAFSLRLLWRLLIISGPSIYISFWLYRPCKCASENIFVKQFTSFSWKYANRSNWMTFGRLLLQVVGSPHLHHDQIGPVCKFPFFSSTRLHQSLKSLFLSVEKSKDTWMINLMMQMCYMFYLFWSFTNIFNRLS